jgi:protocatechuate 3,4-dioxygenase beta subunit
MIRCRRRILAVAVGLALLAAGCGGSTGSTTAIPSQSEPAPSATAGAGSAAPTSASSDTALPSVTAAGGPTCAAPASPTPSQTEGPYYTAGSPEKASLVETGMEGTRLTLVGYVVTTDCTPLPGAKVDVWQADAGGVYDNSGYRLRGYVFTDADGRFTIETIIPGEYPGRTEHIHVKVTPAGGSTLTTQLYFPGVSANDADGIYSPELLLEMTQTGDGYTGTFTFVLAG